MASMLNPVRNSAGISVSSVLLEPISGAAMMMALVPVLASFVVVAVVVVACVFSLSPMPHRTRAGADRFRRIWRGCPRR